MRTLWTSAAFIAAAALTPAACETCSITSVPTVRYCGIGEFCCGNGCCPKTMISFFKLAVGAVLLVMIIVWFCSYLRRGRRREATAWLRPPTVTPPPPYTVHGGVGVGSGACAGVHAVAAGHPLPGHAARTAHGVTRVATVHSATAAVSPVPTHGVHAPALPDDLPPPYHTVVNIPPPYLPSYDGLNKTSSGPT